MKKRVLILSLLAPACLWAQQKEFIIKGRVGRLNAPATIYLAYHVDGGIASDSIHPKDGYFEFSGKIGDPSKGNITLNHTGTGINMKAMDYLSIYVEPGTTTITSPDSMRNATITGSPTTEGYRKLQALLLNNRQKQSQLVLQLRRQGSLSPFDSASKATLALLEQEEADILLHYIKQYPDNYTSLLALSTYGGAHPDSATVAPLFYSLSEEVRNSAVGKIYALNLEKKIVSNIGITAPDFTLNDVNDHPVKLSDFRGKYVLVDFWASWCGPCRKENPNVVSAYNKFKDSNFTILGIALEKANARNAWLNAIEKDGLSWTQVTDFQYFNSPVARSYQVDAIPQNFLIDPSGKIIARNLRGEALQKKLQELFQ